MAIVQKGNKQLKVANELVDKYLADGYSQIENDGKVVKEPTGGRSFSFKDVSALKTEIKDLKAENSSLVAEVESLHAESEQLKKEIESLKNSAAKKERKNKEIGTTSTPPADTPKEPPADTSQT